MSQRPNDNSEYYDRPPVRRKRRKKTPWQKFKEAYLPLIIVLGGIAVIIALIVGGVKLAGRSKGTEPPSQPGSTQPDQSATAGSDVAELLDKAAILAKQFDFDSAIGLLDTYTGDNTLVAQAITDYTAEKGTMVTWSDAAKIPHISFQQLIADPKRAFDSEDGDYYARNCLTTSEFSAVLDQLYDKGYVLVSLSDVANLNAEGKYVAGQIGLPSGRTPLVMSLVPAHYTASRAADGFARRLVVDAQGEIACEYIDGENNTTTGAYDFVSLLEAFLDKHPDFSYRGARAILGVTGDEAPLGYDLSNEDEATKAQEVAKCLRNTGYEFASFTYGGIGYGEASLEEMEDDVKQWQDKVASVLGSSQILIYASGSDIGDYEGEKYEALYNAGFRYFCGMDNTVTAWAEINDSYVRQTRRTINGTRITEDGEAVSDLFNASTVVSEDRP